MDNYFDAPVDRIEQRAEALELLKELRNNTSKAKSHLFDAHPPGRGTYERPDELMDAAVACFNAVVKQAKEDNFRDAEQIAFLLVRDVLVPAAREAPEDEPVQFVTGNSFVPALRSFGVAEAVYTASAQHWQMWEIFVEAVERKCDESHIMLAGPEWDNSLYVVDLDRFEYVGEDFEGGDSLQDEWRLIQCQES